MRKPELVELTAPRPKVPVKRTTLDTKFVFVAPAKYPDEPAPAKR
jgi:hypothetical protein